MRLCRIQLGTQGFITSDINICDTWDNLGSILQLTRQLTNDNNLENDIRKVDKLVDNRYSLNIMLPVFY